MLRLCRNHSAFNSHNFPRTMVLMVHATTFQPYCSHRDLTRRSSLVRKLPASDCCTRGPLSCRLFPLALQTGLFRCRFSSWLCTTLSDYSPPLLPLCFQLIQPTCRDCSLHVPRRFVEGAGLEPTFARLADTYAFYSLSAPLPNLSANLPCSRRFSDRLTSSSPSTSGTCPPLFPH